MPVNPRPFLQDLYVQLLKPFPTGYPPTTFVLPRARNDDEKRTGKAERKR